MSASLTFVTPPPGLDPVVDFTLAEIAGAAGLYSLQAAAQPSTRLFVVDASVHLPDYSPVISFEQSDALGVTDPQDAMLLVVANPAPAGTTVNLMAPIVVNASTGASAQIILDNQDFPLRAALVPRAAAASRPAAVPVAV
ncbi:flagellar assembly protein FliW [Frondihabitans sp. PAMC 28766]|uniref:flagellar assembly protein FliW n=1 Tax=Frondihabitans sp. PAMC 28766 TaxID=1795630 RepID=UPI00078BA616|nr:flagellar assembly protein FliW [Frondihabitans sp. PAMC 28766]AMM19691.1 flagellar assembly protein FliW [Frondihabitans sp. PAMC 28766]